MAMERAVELLAVLLMEDLHRSLDCVLQGLSQKQMHHNRKSPAEQYLPLLSSLHMRCISASLPLTKCYCRYDCSCKYCYSDSAVAATREREGADGSECAGGSFGVEWRA